MALRVASPLALLPALQLGMPTLALAQEVPVEGDLVISELVIAPTSGSKEWFEVQNVSGGDLELQGCTLTEGHYNEDKSWTGHDDTVDDSLILEDGVRAVFMVGSSGDTEPLCAAYEDAKLTSCAVWTTHRYGSLGFNNSDAETMSITCDKVLVDEVSFDWGEFSDDCPDEYGNNCSVNLDPALIDHESNDDLVNWGVPVEATPAWDHNGSPALSTPGAANLLFVPEPWCEAGDAIITELMIAPPDGYKEWIEIHGEGDADCNIGACQLLLGPSADGSYEPTDEDGWDWDVVDIEAASDSLLLESGGYLLLARSSDWITGDGTGKDDIPADYSASGISLSNSEAEWVHIVCGDDVIDSAPADWGALAGMCPDANCSANLPAAVENGTDNDDIENWCVPPTEPTYLNPSDEIIRATPGMVGSCLELDWPAAGDVIFTEIMASPQGGIPEYIELYSLGSAAVDLDFCSLQRHRLDDDGNVDDSSVKTYLIGNDGRALSVEAGAIQLLSYSDCLFATDTAEPSDTAGETASCDQNEFVYSTIQLSADEEEHLSLLCPDADGDEVVVDTISFQFSVLGIQDGHSLMLDPDLANAEDNDDSSSWCTAAYSQKIEELSDDVEDCNYGTPGAIEACLVDTPEPLEPVCRCSSRGAPGGWLLLGLLALAGVLSGRREEDHPE